METENQSWDECTIKLILAEHFYYHEKVDVVKPKDQRVLDALVSSIRGRILIVKYVDTNEEEAINIDDNLVLKQCTFNLILGVPGRPFRRLNRIDIRSKNLWHEGVVIEVEDSKILIRFNNIKERKIEEEWENFNSKNIAPAGKHSGKFNPNLHSSEEINKIFSKNKKFFKANEIQEKVFREEIKSVNLEIKDIAGDGNCLYRAVADQVYGTENYYELLKSKCLDYLSLEREFFSKFIEGGIDNFEEYITMKRMDGVWGDDLEIQALSEIYNRPIEIYSHSKQPLKTFHETEGSHRRGVDRGLNDKWLPIRLSYHGRAHYNSIVPVDRGELKCSFLRSPPGEYENCILEKVKTKSITKDESLFNSTNQINSKPNDNENVNLEFSRDHFAEKKNTDLDRILQETYSDNKNGSNAIDEALKISEQSATEQEMLNLVLEQSKQENNTNYESDLTCHPSIKFLLEMGYTLEEAVLAYSAVGQDPEHMLQYLYSVLPY